MSGPDWAAELTRLDGLRARAFAEGDPALLSQVWVAGSPAAASDQAALAALVAAGRTAVGLRHEVRQVTEQSVDALRAELRVVDVLTPHLIKDAAGLVVEQRPGRGEQTLTVVLVRRDVTWQLASVTAA